MNEESKIEAPQGTEAKPNKQTSPKPKAKPKAKAKSRAKAKAKRAKEIRGNRYCKGNPVDVSQEHARRSDSHSEGYRRQECWQSDARR